MGLFSIFKKEQKEDLNKGLEKTKQSIFSRITKAIAGKNTVDDDFLDELENILISSDVGVETTLKIIDRLTKRVAGEKYFGSNELNEILKEEVVKLLSENNTPDFTIGKLAYQFKQSGKNVLLGAADTFRAAAVDQLTIWADRVGVPIIKQQMGADPAAVAFDTVNAAKTQNADVVLIDTAGRLHNKVNLMNELSKIKRVIQKVYPDAPHDVLLVLDASTGQNAFEQAKQFTAATEVTCLALTKLDGTAKGGVVLGIADQFKIPVKYIGVGEKMHQLQVFNKSEFVDSLLG